MTQERLITLNAMWTEVDNLINDLMGDCYLQLVCETNIAESNGHQGYWLANHDIMANDVPVLSWCFEIERQQEDYEFLNWYDLADRIFDLYSEGIITDLHLEYM